MWAGWIIASLCAWTPAGDKLLDPLLRQYFLGVDAAARRKTADEICALPGLTCDKLAEAIRAVQLWDSQRSGQYEVRMRLGDQPASEKQVWLSVPAAYEPAKRWALILTFHGQGGQAHEMLSFTRQLLGRRADDFLIAAPQDIGPLGLTQPESDVAQPRALVMRLRQLFHIDSDHVFVMGYSLGGHNSWISAVMHADCFAGVMPLATPLQMVGGEALYDEVLPNARNTAILFCWGELDNLDAQGNPSSTGGNVALNRKMTAVMRGLGFPHFEAIELPGIGHAGVRPPDKSLAALLDRRRVHFPSHVRQTFRLPVQSRAYWVEAEGMQGEPLPNETIQIKVPNGQDPLVAQKKYLINRLGLIEATCDDQSISLKGRRARTFVLRLGADLVDLTKPVTILRNGKKRFAGTIDPDARVMLEEAARDWDFDRLLSARVVVPLTGNVQINLAAQSIARKKK